MRGKLVKVQTSDPPTLFAPADQRPDGIVIRTDLAKNPSLFILIMTDSIRE